MLVALHNGQRDGVKNAYGLVSPLFLVAIEVIGSLETLDDDRSDVLCDSVHRAAPTHDRCGNESLKLSISVVIQARAEVCSYLRYLAGDICRSSSKGARED